MSILTSFTNCFLYILTSITCKHIYINVKGLRTNESSLLIIMLYTKNLIYETDFALIKYLCHPILSYAHRHYQVGFCKYNHGSL